MPEMQSPAAMAEVSPSTSSPAPTESRSESGGGQARNEKGQFQAAGTPKEPVAKREDAQDIYSKVRDRLEKFREAAEKEDKTPEAEAPAEKAEQPATETKPDSSLPTEAKAEAEESETGETEKPAEEAAADVTPAPTLPAAHVRSLKAYGLSDAEIAKTSPEVAAALHARRNQEITRWAEAGRKQQVQTQQPPAVQVNPTTAPQTPPAQPAAAAVSPVDIAKLKETYGENEPLIQKLAAQEQELAEFRQFRQAWQQQQEQQRMAALVRDVDSFFGHKDMAPYHATYGTSVASATPEQSAKQQEVLRLADSVLGYFQQQGSPTPLQDALQHAFDSVSAPLQKEAARQEIKGELTKRAKGLSMKPGGKPTPKPVVPARQELEAKTRANLRKVFAGS